MDIRPLDLADDSALTAAYLIECSATQRVRPDWVPLGQEARIFGWRADSGWTKGARRNKPGELITVA